MNYKHLKEYYKGKKVFLTGHTGFKGAWLLAWLHELGATIKGYALLSPNTFDLYPTIEGDKLCHSVIADIRDKARLEKEIIDFQPDFIFHLAAQPLVRLSYQIPIDTFAVNAIGTAHVLDALRQLNKPCTVISITTDKVYENLEWVYPYRENDRLGGFDPYSASKACAELIIASYRNSFFNLSDYSGHKKSIASARAGNVIGGGDWAKDRIFPDIIRSLSKQQTIEVRQPKAIRPWQHVLESIGGYLHLGTKMVDNPIKYATAWNFGPNASDNLTVEALVKIAIEQWGSGTYQSPENVQAVHEAGLLKLDINKANALLGWYPKWQATQAIKETMDWYKNFNDGEDGLKLVVAAIKNYGG